MKKIATLYILMLVFACLIACENEATTEPIPDKFGELMTLKTGETVEVNGETLTLTFDKIVEDSRCPNGTDCFWEGQAEVGLLINETTEILVILRASKEDLAKDTLDNLVVTLLDVRPYPDVKDELPIPLEDYVIDIQVDEL